MARVMTKRVDKKKGSKFFSVLGKIHALPAQVGTIWDGRDLVDRRTVIRILEHALERVGSDTRQRPKQHIKRKGPKFRVGQVVALTLAEGRGFGFGEFLAYKKNGNVELQFWDTHDDFWSWDYQPQYVRPLTARERGGK